jgi:hypothetical protein
MQIDGNKSAGSMITATSSELIYRKLVLVRQIYKKSLELMQRSGHYADKILSLIGFDLANETVIKVFLSSEASYNSKRELKFHEIIDESKKVFSSKGLGDFPKENNIAKVRKNRNFAQHESDPPSEETLNDARTYTRDFLTEFCSSVWEVDFEKISLVSLVQDSDLRNALSDAEESLVKMEYDDVCIATIDAFQTFTSKMKSVITGFQRYGRSYSVDDNVSRINEINVRLENLEWIVVNSILGIDIGQYAKFFGVKKHFHVHRLGPTTSDRRAAISGPSATKEDAEYMLAFVTDAIVTGQSLLDYNQMYPTELSFQ